MRSAKIGDYWRRTYKRNYRIKLSHFKFSNLRGIGQGEINFHGGLTAICGANGAGKTTLLSALVGIIKPEEAEDSSIINLKLEGADLTICIEKEGSDAITVNYNNGELMYENKGYEELEMTWIDLSAYGPNLLQYFTEVTNLQEHLESVDSYTLNEKELNSISYILGRKYDTCSFYELEIDGSEIPYFEVSVNGLTYGTESMGLGEVSALYIYWCLSRAAENSILIVDEPETYLAHNSQSALIDVLAKFCSEKSIWGIVATHSFAILNRIPSEHVKLLSRVGNNVRISSHENSQIYLQALGMPAKKSGIILVEDRAAREISKLLINTFAPHVSAEFEIIDVGSVEDIKRCLKFPRVGNWIKIIGLFDGDQHTLSETYNWPYTFLPGSLPPEKLLKLSTEKQIDLLSQKLNRDSNDVHIILSVIDGLDHHDWLEELYKKLGIDYNYLIKCLFDVFLVENEEEAWKSFENIYRIMNSEH
ncbi:AAA family ATPase [Bacillus tropicus]|uniref:ATP-dependent nuclease n=1 Tax=Bacillus tropicus TaxID=2026188 RepID=UPI000CD8CA7A|nr:MULTISPECIES: AAA family ATPase [Bacillus cereus group]MCC2339652.1 AAA family ATPase [Bacillus tropicus]MCU5423647.1 AAA family ATPase [Bacillus tropicus]